MNSDKLLYDLFRAYYDARKNKRSTINALAFEIDYEKNFLSFIVKSKKEDMKSGPVFVL